MFAFRPMRIGACIMAAVLFAVASVATAHADDGYRLWLRYDRVGAYDLATYRAEATQLVAQGASPTLIAARKELARGLSGLLGRKLARAARLTRDGAIVIGTPASSKLIAGLDLDLGRAGAEGYLLKSVTIGGHPATVVAANRDIGVLYGTFALLRRIAMHAPLSGLDIVSAPRIKLRVLDHWDNLDRTVERGYAGQSLWNWTTLPTYIEPRYIDYARADASIGINGAVLNNVNADPLILTPRYLKKVAALAKAFRPYGVRVYLSINFASPIMLGHLKTADPLAPKVQAWWRAKVGDIYRLIPDFGGFLVKANSEGQPGPQDYHRTHAQGANMLARALAPHGGVVMWRAFVYANNPKEDRAEQAYKEFTPLDGKFDSNVLVQVKNGPLDFQPREPFNPLLGALPHTNTMMEVQITKEYLGFATHLVYLGALYREVLKADTYARGPGSTVAKVIDGRLFGNRLTGIAGVANTGTDRNWCGSIFNQANWYAFGRLAWNPDASARAIADEWARQTFTNDPNFVKPVVKMMMTSRAAVVNYMTPLGLNMIMGHDTHYGPAPWDDKGQRADWKAPYYHHAGRDGLGFDRTKAGSNEAAQYFSPLSREFENVQTTPEKYLLWFHHVPWSFRLKSGRTLWDGLVYHYARGIQQVAAMQRVWARMKPFVDPQRYALTAAFLKIQRKEATLWRNACLAYFDSFAHHSYPPGTAPPPKPLSYYEGLSFPYMGR